MTFHLASFISSPTASASIAAWISFGRASIAFRQQSGQVYCTEVLAPAGRGVQRLPQEQNNRAAFRSATFAARVAPAFAAFARNRASASGEKERRAAMALTVSPPG